MPIHPEGDLEYIGHRPIATLILPDIINAPDSYQAVSRRLERIGPVVPYYYPEDHFDPNKVLEWLLNKTASAQKNGNLVQWYGTSLGTRIILDCASQYGIPDSVEMIWMNGFLPSFHEATLRHGQNGLLNAVINRKLSTLRYHLSSDVNFDRNTSQGFIARAEYMAIGIRPESVPMIECPVMISQWDHDVFDVEAWGEQWYRRFPNRVNLSLPGLHGHTKTASTIIGQNMIDGYRDLLM